MWLFFISRLRQWLAVAVPLLLLVVRLIRQALERRSGQTRLTGALRRVEEVGRRRRNRSKG